MGTRTAPDAEDVPALQADVARLRTDLERQIRANRSMEQAVQNFVSELAHDLKNPLAAIKIGVQGLQRGLQRGGVLDAAEAGERLARMDKAVEHAKELIAAARARAAQETALELPLRREPVDVIGVLREVVRELREHVGERRLQLDCAQPLLIGEFDPARLRQALVNVIDNALQFSPAGTSVKVAVNRDSDGNALVIGCKDYGIGIPASDLPHLGERYYRAENVLGRYKGSGTGLFEAKAAIAAHGGQLTVDSVEGAGSMVTIRLPLA